MTTLTEKAIAELKAHTVLRTRGILTDEDHMWLYRANNVPDELLDHYIELCQDMALYWLWVRQGNRPGFIPRGMKEHFPLETPKPKSSPRGKRAQ